MRDKPTWPGRKPVRLPVVLTQEEARALLAQPTVRYRTGHRDRCLMQLMLNAGLRCQEALNVRTGDIDWTSGQLMVRQGKGKKDRVLWLNEPVLADLRLWKGRRPPQAEDLLFPTLKGTPLYPSAVREMIKRRARKAGIPKDVHPHTLRHTYATELYRQCHNLMIVQKALGHSHYTSTMIYTHLVDADFEAALRDLRIG